MPSFLSIFRYSMVSCNFHFKSHELSREGWRVFSLTYSIEFMNRDNSVGIATRQPAGRSGFHGSIIGSGWEFFSSPPYPDRLWGPLSSYAIGTGDSSTGGKAAGREAGLSPPSSTEVKNAWSYTSTSNTSSWAMLR
jgi:hypothetical protein